MYRYEIIIYWSAEDNTFVAEAPELPGCLAHGNSYSEALKNAEDAIELWIETTKEFNDTIPEPKGRKLQYE